MKLHPIVEATFRRISARHDRRWYGLADCDTRYDPDAEYFARLRDALHRQMGGT